ncbi:MAG: ABC transporter ATP-binding protein [Desulfurococcaceae archaeon]
MTYLELINITKKYGKSLAVDKVNLSVDKGEFIVLLGPSGCGKTTTLRIIAGLVYPDEGRVIIDGRDVTYLEPGERDVSMVFQDYALYPHMTVFDNIAFPLVVKKKKLGLSKEEIRERVHRVSKMLGIEELLERKPLQLSGGQQQRVALARALVVEPKVWLMDEPLSNLDALIRVQVRAELKRLQKDLGITTIYVTHDQVEALTLADRVAVMNKGRMIQIGTPKEIYETPRHVFVATFVGSPPMNVIECNVTSEILDCQGFNIKIPRGFKELVGENKIYLGIRPEHIEVSEKPVNGGIKGVIYIVETLGSEFIVNIKLGDSIVKAKTLREISAQSGEPVYLKFNWRNVLIFDKKTGEYLEKLTELIKRVDER